MHSILNILTAYKHFLRDEIAKFWYSDLLTTVYMLYVHRHLVAVQEIMGFLENYWNKWIIEWFLILGKLSSFIWKVLRTISKINLQVLFYTLWKKGDIMSIFDLANSICEIYTATFSVLRTYHVHRTYRVLRLFVSWDLFQTSNSLYKWKNNIRIRTYCDQK